MPSEPPRYTPPAPHPDRAAHHPGSDRVPYRPRQQAPYTRSAPKNGPLSVLHPTNLPLDQARLLPRFRTPNWQTPARLDGTTEPDWRPGDNTKPTNPIISWTAEDLRGVPIVGRGSPGTQPGTDPYTATAGKERSA